MLKLNKTHIVDILDVYAPTQLTDIRSRSGISMVVGVRSASNARLELAVMMDGIMLPLRQAYLCQICTYHHSAGNLWHYR